MSSFVAKTKNKKIPKFSEMLFCKKVKIFRVFCVHNNPTTSDFGVNVLHIVGLYVNSQPQ